MSKVKDKATAFKNEVAGSQTNKILCKASSHEVAGPKKKHVDCECRVQQVLPSLPLNGPVLLWLVFFIIKPRVNNVLHALASEKATHSYQWLC